MRARVGAEMANRIPGPATGQTIRYQARVRTILVYVLKEGGPMTRSQKGRGGKEVSGRGERAETREVERLILGPWVVFRAKSNWFFPRRRKPGTASRSVVIRKEASLHGSERQINPAKDGTKGSHH